MKPLSPTDSMFLWMETRNQPMHVAGLNLYTPPRGAGADFIQRLVQGWRQHLQAVPPFNLRPVLKLGRWYWDEDGDFELDYHLRHVALPRPGRIRELLAMVSRVHGNLLDRNRPLWEAYVIEGLPGGRFATYTKIHHALVDGVSGAKMMADGLSRSAAETKPPLWAQTLRKRVAPPGKAMLDRWVASAAEAARATGEILPGVGSGLWELVRSSQAEAGSTTPYEAPPTPFNTEITGSRRFAAQSYSLDRLKKIGKATGATVNDVTLAICAGALRRYLLSQDVLPRKPLTAMVPVSLHGQSDDSGEGGNQVALLLANLATHIADPMKRLKRIVASTAAAKQQLSKMGRMQKIAHGATMLAPMGVSLVTGHARKRPAFNLVISNVPGPRETLYLDGARLDEVYPVSIPTHYLALNITISGYGDNLGFGYIACRRSVPALQRMLDYTDESILELEQALADKLKPAEAAPAKAPVRKRTTISRARK
jgi:diacylglycerol O-acyltransferase / wax synthase